MLKTIAIALLVLVGLPTLFFGYWGCSWVGDAAATVTKQFAPSTMLARYEWFKDAHARIAPQDPPK